MNNLMADKEDKDTMLEGRSAAFSVGIEKKILSNVNNFKRDIFNGESARQKAFEKMESDTRAMLENIKNNKE